MFKIITVSCLLAVSVHCVPAPSPAVPYYPQPYPAAYSQVYPAQPKYNVQPAFVAPYAPASYRQVLVPANPAYNAYYYGYNPYSAYPQQYSPYPYVQNDGTPAPAAPAPSGWGEYLNSIWNYVPNYPFGGSASEGESSQAESGATSSAESSAVSEAAAVVSPGKGDKPAEGQKTEAPKAEQQPAGNDQTAQAPFKPFGPAPFVYLGQPQFYGQLPYQQPLYDPSKLNAANNGAVSSYLFYRNQPQPVYQQPQPFADQKYFQAPSPQSYQGTAALAYQRYLQNQKPFVQGQYQQQQDQSFQQQQAFQPQQDFQQQQQQYDQQPQQDEPSVVVDSNSPAVQVNAEGQQKSQSKLATGPTVALAQPQGVAFAGIGGRAGAAPTATAIVGNNSTAIAGPSATAVSLDATPQINLTPVNKLTTAYVAKYAPELGQYRVAEIETP